MDELNSPVRDKIATSGDPGGAPLLHGVYSRLRADILNGILRPNQSLVESELAEQLNVSRMPVRESLQRLAIEGLVRSQRRRWIVHEFTPTDVCEMYEVRAALESEAAYLAAERASDEQIQQILDAGSPELFSKASNKIERVESNERFHDLICVASRNSRLKDALEKSTIFHFNLSVAALYSPAELEESGRQHEEIAMAIAGRNAERARAIAHAHVQHAVGIIRRKMF